MRTFDAVADAATNSVQPGPPMGNWLHRASSTDVDVHCDALRGWRMRYDQIGAGAFSGSFTELSLPRMQFFRETTNRKVHQHGLIGRKIFGIGVPWQSHGEINVNGACVSPELVLTSFDADVDMCTPDDFELRGIVMESALIQDTLASMEEELVSNVWNQMRAMRLAPDQARRLRGLLTFVQEALDATPGVFEDAAARKHLADSFLLEIIESLPTARPCDDYLSGAARKRTVARACDLMLAHQEETVSILDVCKSIGASRRKLNYCFLEVVGTSPIRYLRAIRLNGVRRELKQCTDVHTGVHDIAVRWGFWHFSQFSLDYKRQFAELPSETLRRARERPM